MKMLLPNHLDRAETKRKRDDLGQFLDKEKGKTRGVCLPKEIDCLIDDAVEDLNISQSELIAKGFIEWFTKTNWYLSKKQGN